LYDRVIGLGLSYDCRIGLREYERHIKQRVLIDFEAETDWRHNGSSDDPAGIVDYYEVNRRVGRALASREYNLIEAVAEDVARVLCTGFPVQRVRVKVTKTPFDMPNVTAVAVECVREPADFAEDREAT
jgi:7,8-dihydroneopterin aldolase/epimerase/oxygenase